MVLKTNKILFIEKKLNLEKAEVNRLNMECEDFRGQAAVALKKYQDQNADYLQSVREMKFMAKKFIGMMLAKGWNEAKIKHAKDMYEHNKAQIAHQLVVLNSNSQKLRMLEKFKEDNDAIQTELRKKIAENLSKIMREQHLRAGLDRKVKDQDAEIQRLREIVYRPKKTSSTQVELVMQDQAIMTNKVIIKEAVSERRLKQLMAKFRLHAKLVGKLKASQKKGYDKRLVKEEIERE